MTDIETDDFITNKQNNKRKMGKKIDSSRRKHKNFNRQKGTDEKHSYLGISKDNTLYDDNNYDDFCYNLGSDPGSDFGYKRVNVDYNNDFYLYDMFKLESITESIPESITESIPESITESITESIPESIPESIRESITESITESICGCLLCHLFNSIVMRYILMTFVLLMIIYNIKN
jgi:hypothetical protein